MKEKLVIFAHGDDSRRVFIFKNARRKMSRQFRPFVVAVSSVINSSARGSCPTPVSFALIK